MFQTQVALNDSVDPDEIPPAKQQNYQGSDGLDLNAGIPSAFSHRPAMQTMQPRVREEEREREKERVRANPIEIELKRPYNSLFP